MADIFIENEQGEPVMSKKIDSIGYHWWLSSFEINIRLSENVYMLP